MDGARVAAGALTGFVVGMTGVGGGALMTPVLLLAFGTPPLTAVGTDLWFAALTKLAISGLHLRHGFIDWTIVRRLWTGSLPASLVTVLWMTVDSSRDERTGIVTMAVAVAVSLTAVSLLASRKLRAISAGRGLTHAPLPPSWEVAATVAAGAVLGCLVTMTSVGAGALGAVFLVHLYPTRLTPVRLVATDIAHAIPLALCAGIGHLTVSHVDLDLLRDLLVGSVPAALAGVAVSARMPQTILRTVLGLILLGIGMAMFVTASR